MCKKSIVKNITIWYLIILSINIFVQATSDEPCQNRFKLVPRPCDDVKITGQGFYHGEDVCYDKVLVNETT